MPLLVTAAAVWSIADVRFEQFRPTLNDEVYYWHQTRTFAEVGTGGGVYSIEENAAPVWRFGMHGPFYPMLVGTAARAIGWYRHSGPLFNMAWLAVAVAVTLALCRPPPGRALLLALALGTFWALPFWAATNMQESFHHGVGIIAGGVVAALLDGRHRRAALAVGAIVLGVAVLVRPSWALLLPIVAALSGLRDRRPARAVAGAVLAAGAGALLVWTYARLVAPDPGGFTFLRVTTFDAFAASTRANALANLARLADLSDDFDPLELLHRAQYLFVLLGAAVAAGVAWRRPDRSGWLVHLANVGGITAAMLLLYQFTNQTEYRIISSHLAATLVALSLTPRRAATVVVGIVIAANVAAAGVFAESFRENRRASFGWDPRPLRVFEELIAPRLTFAPQASPWCNTLLTSEYPPEFIAVPAGIGISFIRDPERQPLPPRSRYLFLNDDVRQALGGRLHAEPLVALPSATLYINTDAACDP